MNPLFAIVIALVILAIAAVVWDVRSDGYRASPVDPELRQRLLDREELRLAHEDAQRALEAAHHAPVPPQLAAYGASQPVATPRPRIGMQRAAR